MRATHANSRIPASTPALTAAAAVGPAKVAPAEVAPAEVAHGAAVAPLLPVVGGDLAVPLVGGGEVPYANLDYAASAPCLAVVADHLDEVLPYYASVHRGAGFASAVSTALYEAARAEVAAFTGARPDDAVVFTRNTTDALNLLANCLPRGAETVFLDLEHHANLLPWQRRRHRCVPAAETRSGTVDALARALRERPAALLAVTGASNVTGEVLPLADIVALAHGAGARVAVDAAQLAPHRRLDVAAAGIDYVALSGHKLYAPFGAGALVGRADWLDDAPPYLAGGGAVAEVSVATTSWAKAPQRHEGGTPNVLGAATLASACRALRALPDGALERHERTLRERLTGALGEIGGARTHRLWEGGGDAIGVVAFSLDGHDAGLVAACLSAEHGVGVRDGRFCAHPLLQRLTGGRGALRASFGVGSSSSDVDRLVDGLAAVSGRGPRWTYAEAGGRWSPRPDPRPAPAWSTVGEEAAGASPCEVGGPGRRDGARPAIDTVAGRI